MAHVSKHIPGFLPNMVLTLLSQTEKTFHMNSEFQSNSVADKQFNITSRFHAKSWADVNPKHQSKHSAWETPDPAFWTAHDYVVVRADERGTGNSPGKLDSMSSATCDGFVDVIEWAAAQPWSSGKVGLVGISYYAGSQWRAAARKPTGLTCIVPWEGRRKLLKVTCC